MFGGIGMRFSHGDSECTDLNDAYDLPKVYGTWAIANAR